ncbi:MAG: hypothetical protein UV36_C0047G0009 [Parcubacteria group bacterium GW2011_GWC2_42_6]|nr:MAG: hypothetical protein UV36_C0047G0009 [Parcubacteria group bacterium GW2011_GWC2_42_6]
MAEPGTNNESAGAPAPDIAKMESLGNKETPEVFDKTEDPKQKLETALNGQNYADEIRQKAEADLEKTQKGLNELRGKMGLPEKSVEDPNAKLKERLLENEGLLKKEEEKFLGYPENPENYEKQTAQKNLDLIGAEMIREMREASIADFIREMKAEFFKKFEKHLNRCVNKDKAIELMNLKIEIGTRAISKDFLEGKTDELNYDFLAELQISHFKIKGVEQYYVTGFNLNNLDKKIEADKREFVGKDENKLKQAEEEGVLKKEKV